MMLRVRVARTRTHSRLKNHVSTHNITNPLKVSLRREAAADPVFYNAGMHRHATLLWSLRTRLRHAQEECGGGGGGGWFRGRRGRGGGEERG